MHPRVTEYDRACYKIAVRNGGRGVPIDDLFQEARIATDKALRSFDSERGVKELTYVYFCVSRHLWSCLKTNRRKIRGLVFCGEMFDRGYEDPDSEPLDLEVGFSALDSREIDIVWTHVKGMTFRELGKSLRLSPQRVQQIHARALHKMRSRIEGVKR